MDVPTGYLPEKTSAEARLNERLEAIGAAEILAVQLLHPATSGFTVFALGDEEGVIPRLAIPSKTLATNLPCHLNRDSYISINQSSQVYRDGNPKHRTDTIGHLCAVYVDLDYYSCGLTEEGTLAEIRALQDGNQIPRPSLLAYSGRGLWVVWLLGDEAGSGRPVSVTTHGKELERHGIIQHILHQRLAHLGSDKNALSPVRYLRIPGSLNTKSETVVRWEIQTDHSCQIPRYTLDQLIQHFGLAKTSAHRAARVVSPPIDQSHGSDGPRRGQAGWRGLRDRRYRDFQKLRTIRGGFREGCRNNAVFYYSILLAQSGVPIEKAKDLAEQLNASFLKPLKLPKAVSAAVVSAYSRKYKRIRDQRIADLLIITPAEAEQLECKAIASRFRVQPDQPAVPKQSRKERDSTRVASRRAAIQRIVAEYAGQVPTTRTMAALLQEQGIIANYVTLSGDYKALGLSSRPTPPISSG